MKLKIKWIGVTLFTIFMSGCLNTSNLDPQTQKKINILKKQEPKIINKSFNINFYKNSIFGNNKYDKEVLFQHEILAATKLAINKTKTNPSGILVGYSTDSYPFFSERVLFPQAAYPEEHYENGLIKEIYYKIFTDKNQINLYKINSKLNFNEFTIGLTSISNADDLKRLVNINNVFDNNLQKELFKVLSKKQPYYFITRPKQISFKINYNDKTIFWDTYKRIFKPIKVYPLYSAENNPNYFCIKYGDFCNYAIKKPTLISAIKDTNNNTTFLITQINLYKDLKGLQVDITGYGIGKMDNNNHFSLEKFSKDLKIIFEKGQLLKSYKIIDPYLTEYFSLIRMFSKYYEPPIVLIYLNDIKE